MSDPKAPAASAADDAASKPPPPAPAAAVLRVGDRLRVWILGAPAAVHVVEQAGEVPVAEIARACGAAKGATARVALPDGRVLEVVA